MMFVTILKPVSTRQIGQWRVPGRPEERSGSVSGSSVSVYFATKLTTVTILVIIGLVLGLYFGLRK